MDSLHKAAMSECRVGTSQRRVDKDTGARYEQPQDDPEAWKINLEALCKELNISDHMRDFCESEEITVEILKSYTQKELIDLGFSTGPCKRIIKWAARSIRPSNDPDRFEAVCMDIGLDDRGLALIIEHELTSQTIPLFKDQEFEEMGFDADSRMLIQSWMHGYGFISKPTGMCSIISRNGVFNQDKIIVTGSHNTIKGDCCVVRGNDNVVHGDDCTIYGAKNVIHGDECLVYGNANVITGNECRTNNDSAAFYRTRPIDRANHGGVFVRDSRGERDDTNISDAITHLSSQGPDEGVHSTEGDERSDEVINFINSVTKNKIAGRIGIPKDAKITFIDKAMTWTTENISSIVADCSAVSHVNGVPMKEVRKNVATRMLVEILGEAKQHPWTDDESACVICVDAKHSIIFGCTHQCTCPKCAIMLLTGGVNQRNCPYCRKEITSVLSLDGDARVHCS